MKWTMINGKLFTGEKDGYTVDIILGGLYPSWVITKG